MTRHRTRRSVMATIALLFTVVAVLVGAGVAAAAPDRHPTEATPDRSHGEHGGAQERASLTVLAPTPNQTVTGPEMAVHVVAHDFRLDARYAGTPVKPGLGHFHTIIDGHLIDMSPWPDGTRDTISMVGLQPGPHVLTIVPAGNDHMELTSAAVEIPFTYAGPYLPEPAGYEGAGMPSISLSSPASGSVVKGSTLTLTADIRNLVLCGDCFGKPNVTGEGHWHIFLDLPADAMTPMAMMPHMMTMASDTSQVVSLKGVAPGTHTFTAVLVGNDHMPPMVMAMSSVTVTVAGGH